MSKTMRLLFLSLVVFVFWPIGVQADSYSVWQSPETKRGPDTGLKYSAMAWADFDFDGDIDVAVQGQDDSGDSRLFVYKNHPSGELFLKNEIMGAGKGVAFGDLAWNNFDGDSDVDLTVTGESSDGEYQFGLYQNNGAGAFTEIDTPLQGDSGLKHSALAYSGGTGGDTELQYLAVMGDTGSKILRVYTVTSSGTGVSCTNPVDLFEEYETDTGLTHGDLAWSDYDQDGDQDLVALGKDSDSEARLIIFEQATGGDTTGGDTGNEFVTHYRDELKGLKYGQVNWVDYDNDGDTDLTASGLDNQGTPRLIIYEQADTVGETFETYEFYEPLGTDRGLWKSSMDWGNINEDSYPDLAVSGIDNTGDSRLITFVNQGDGTLKVHEELTPGLSHGDLKQIDLEGDGDDDLAVTGSDSSGRSRFIIYELSYDTSVDSEDNNTDSSQDYDDNECLIQRMEIPEKSYPRLRLFRDILFRSSLGRCLVRWYYEL